MYFSGQIDKVYLDIKIANYTEESTGRNRGATGSGKIVIGLYGKAAPESVKRFLATIDGKRLFGMIVFEMRMYRSYMM